MTRDKILEQALHCVSGDREQDYGSPEQNFRTIALMWSVYIQRLGRGYLEDRDVAAMLALLKIARIASGHAKADNWIDLAGYAACGGEIESGSEEVQVGGKFRIIVDNKVIGSGLQFKEIAKKVEEYLNE